MLSAGEQKSTRHVKMDDEKRISVCIKHMATQVCMCIVKPGSVPIEELCCAAQREQDSDPHWYGGGEVSPRPMDTDA